MARILIIDDDESMRHVLSRTVRRLEHEPVTAATLAEGRDMTRSGDFDIIFLDVHLPDGNGLTILTELTQAGSRPEVIIITGHGDPDGAELAITNGAWDYIEKTHSVQQISLTLKRAVAHHEERKRKSSGRVKALRRKGIIGESGALTRALDLVAQASESDSGVLITGETGTGKELFAQTIHHNSPRADGPFIAVDCAALPEHLVESILFGHAKGAFTGAEKDQTGLILQADGGTLFLDEVCEMPVNVQKAFLRVLQERTVRPLGGKKERPSNFRLISATNQNPEKMVRDRSFREDLLYRIQSVRIHLPPLRERTGDIRPLAGYLLENICERSGVPGKTGSHDFFEVLEDYPWPGNVREMINTLEHAVGAAGSSPQLYAQHLPPMLRAKVARARVVGPREEPDADEPESVPQAPENIPPLNEYRDTVYARAEKNYLQQLLQSTGSNMKEALRISSLSQSRLYALLKKHGLQKRQCHNNE